LTRPKRERECKHERHSWNDITPDRFSINYSKHEVKAPFFATAVDLVAAATEVGLHDE
jgi:hypothetical protein